MAGRGRAFQFRNYSKVSFPELTALIRRRGYITNQAMNTLPSSRRTKTRWERCRSHQQVGVPWKLSRVPTG
jgi:hypothetical protein